MVKYWKVMVVIYNDLNYYDLLLSFIDVIKIHNLKSNTYNNYSIFCLTFQPVICFCVILITLLQIIPVLYKMFHVYCHYFSNISFLKNYIFFLSKYKLVSCFGAYCCFSTLNLTICFYIFYFKEISPKINDCIVETPFISKFRVVSLFLTIMDNIFYNCIPF